MKILIPPSVFAGILTFNLGKDVLDDLHSVASGMISNEFKNSDYDVALIPSLDLLKHSDFYVSSKVAISFDGTLGNSYLYFGKEKKNISKVFLTGDVSSNDALVTKMVFEEFYGNPVEIVLTQNINPDEDKNFLLSGNKNFEELLYLKGISLAEQLAEFLDYPYVNYVLVSKSEETIRELNKYFEKTDEKIEDTVSDILKNFLLPEEAKEFLKKNLNSVYFEMTQNEIEGLNELLRYAYYKSVVEEIPTVKFVD